MAIIKEGQVGSFNGKIGQVVVANWRDLIVGRSTPKKSTKAPSVGQLDQRSVFKIMIALMKQLKNTIKIGFSAGGNLSAMNAAVKYNLSSAISLVDKKRVIDYSKVRFSNGELLGTFDHNVVGSAGGIMNVTWTIADDIDKEGTDDADLVYLVFYSPITGYSLKVPNVAKRSALKADVKLSSVFAGNSVHVWMFLVSVDGLSVSTSEHVGFKPVLA